MAEQLVPKWGVAGGNELRQSRRWSWHLVGLLLCALVFAVLPGGQIRLGAGQLQGLVGTYLYQNLQQLAPVEGLRVTEVRLSSLHLEWFDVQDYLCHYEIKRNGTLVADHVYGMEWWDEDVPLGTTQVEYSIRAVPEPAYDDQGLPAPPSGADPADITDAYFTSTWESLHVKLSVSSASENQTVDSRLDPRYGNPTLKDFKFGSRIYRGGLYAGLAPDASKVGRSFLKFELPAWADTSFYFGGCVGAYHTASVAAGTTTVSCIPVDPVWSASTLNWTAASALSTTGASEEYDVKCDVGGVTTEWASWNQAPAIYDALTGSGWAGFRLKSTNESSQHWAYFAKKEYDSSLAPRVRYGYHQANTVPAPVDLDADPGSSSGVDLAWTLTSAQRGDLKVQRKTSGGSWEDRTTLTNGTSSWHDTAATGVTYTYRLRFDTLYGGLALYSGEATVTAP